MIETEIHQAIQDAKGADQDLFIRDENGKVFTDPNINPKTTEDNLETSELELASNLSSSPEIETDIKAEEEKTICRSRRLTKTNPIVRYNNPICHDYRKHRKKAELGQYPGSTRHGTGEWKQPSIMNQQADKIQTLRSLTNRDTTGSKELSTVHQHMDLWRNERQKTTKQQYPIGRTSANSRGRNVEGTRLNSYNT